MTSFNRFGLIILLLFSFSASAETDYQDTPDALLNRAFQFFYAQDFKKAETLFQEYVEKYGEQEVPLHYLGRIALNQGENLAATEFFQRAVKADPRSIDSWMLLAELYTRQQKLDRSIECYHTILGIEPFNEIAIISLATIYQNKQKEREAMNMYKRLVIAVHSNGDARTDFLQQAYGNLGHYYYRQGNYEKSIYYHEKLSEIDEDNLRALLILGELHKLTGNFEKADDILYRLLEMKPDYLPALESLFESQYILDDVRIRRTAELYVEKSGKDKVPVLIRAFISEMEGRDEEASGLFDQILSQNQNRLSAHIGKFRLLKRKPPGEEFKKEAFTIVILAQRIGANKLARFYFGPVSDILQEESREIGFQKEFLSAQKDLPLLLDAKVENLANDFIEAYSTHGMTLDSLNEKTGAAANYQQALAIAEQLARIYREQKKSVSQSGMKKLTVDAGEIDGKLDKLNRRIYQILLNLGWLYHEKPFSKQQDALTLQERARVIFPDFPQANFLAGLIHYQLGQEKPVHYQKSISFLDRAIALFRGQSKDPVPGSYFFYLGMAQEKADRFPEAEASLGKAIEAEPYNSTYLNYLGYMYSVRGINLARATELLVLALEDDPENEAYLDSLGWIQYKQGRHKEALVQLLLAASHAEKKNKMDSVIYFHLATVYFEMKDYPLAHYYYGKSLTYKSTASEELNEKEINERMQWIEQNKKH